MGLTFATPVEQAREELLRRLTDQLFVAVGGDLDGARVVTASMVSDAFTEPLPAQQDHGAAVVTPALVEVQALCPNCHEQASLSVTIKPKLEVEDSGASIKLALKSKSVGHTCGQVALPAPDDSQGSFELGDIVGEGPRCTCAKGGNDAERDEWSTTVEECAVHGTAATAEADADGEERGESAPDELPASEDVDHDDDPDELLPA